MHLMVANDNGNAEQALFINGTEIRSPNVFAKVAQRKNLDDVNLEYVLTHIHDNLIVAIDGALYYVGAHALDSGQHCRSITVGVDNDKVSSEIVYINTLAHIAGEAVALAYAEEELTDDTLKVDVDMTTAIPVSYYSRSKATAFEKKFMGKKHTVTVYAGAQEYVVFLHFRFVKVIPEGVTAAHAFRANFPYGIQEVFAGFDSDTVRVMHIAIGEGPTEFPITQGIAFKPDFITGTHNGNGHAITRIIESFKEEFGLRSVTRQDFSRYVRDASHKYHDAAITYLMPALEDEAEDILSTAESVLSSANNEVDVVAVYGGGSILMREALEKRLKAFCSRAKIKLYYVEDPYDAVMIEAYGLDAFLHSKLFAQLKEIAKAKKGAA